jgi:hypothetical protein
VAQLPYEARFYPLGNRALVLDGDRLLTLRGEELAFDAGVLRGMESVFSPSTLQMIAGTYPDVFLAQYDGSAEPELRLRRWSKDQWSVVPSALKSSPDRVVRWFDGRQVLVATSGIGGSLAFTALDGDACAPLPEPTQSDAKEGRRPCRQRVGVHDVEVLSDGHAYSVGVSCGDFGRDVLVERWEPGERTSRIDVVPSPVAGSLLQRLQIAAVSPKDVLVGASYMTQNPDAMHGSCARFDGERWTVEPMPSDGRMSALTAGPDGRVWAAIDGKLHVRSEPGHWVRVPLPVLRGIEVEPERIWLRTADDVWIWGDHGSDAAHVLLHAGGSPAPASAVR